MANDALLVAVPFGVVTDTRPEEAPAGTTAVSTVSATALKAAAFPLKVTAEASFRQLPVRVTSVPAVPHSGARA